MVSLVLVALTPVLVALAALVVAIAAASVFVFVVRGARTRAWVEAFFRKPPRAGQPPDREHYYRPYWGSPSAS